MKKELAVTVLALSLLMGIASGAAQTKEQTSNVSVSVNPITQLDVRPTELSYGATNTLNPGDSQTNSEGGYQYIEIGNIGSQEIGEIFAEATMPSNQTFGATGLDTGEQFDTGNFVTVSTEKAQTYDLPSGVLAELNNMHYLNRVEYVEETAPTYIKTEPQNDAVNDKSSTEVLSSTDPAEVGRFRVGGAEYFFAFYANGDASTADDSWVLRVGNTPHTATQLGTVDFRNPSAVDGSVDYTEYTNNDATNTPTGSVGSYLTSHEFVSFDTSDSGNFNGTSLVNSGSASAPADLNGAETRGYNLYLNFNGANKTEHHIARTKLNTELNNPVTDSSYGSVDATGAQTELYDAGDEADALQPGQSFPVDIGVQIPLGVAEDRIENGIVTVNAQTFSP